MSTPEWRANNQDKLREYRRRWYDRNAEHAKSKIIERRLELIKLVEDVKNNSSCKVCGESDPCCLDFHHRDPSEKEATIAGIARLKSWKKERILAEISKCDILCANCHRKYHNTHRPLV